MRSSCHRYPPRAHTATPPALWLLVAGLLVAWLPATLAPPAFAQGAIPQPLVSDRDLGNRVCAAHGPYCADLWRAGQNGGMPFNRRISEICLHVQLREGEDAGIACAESAIRGVPSLPVSVLLAGAFTSGERERNPIWHDLSDHEWSSTTTRYFLRIPGYCDRTTPEIFDYLPCLLQQVHFSHVVMKRYRIR